MRVEVFEHLTPETVDGTMAFIGDDEVKAFDGNLRVVSDGRKFAIFIRPCLEGGGLFVGFVQFLAAQHGVQALNGRDDDLCVGIDAVGVKMLDDVSFAEATARAGRVVVLIFLQGLVAEVVAIHQKENAVSASVLEKPPAKGAGSEGLARTGRHLNQGARAIFGERFLQTLNGVDLAITQAIGIEGRHDFKPSSQRVRILQPCVKGLRLMEREHTARTRVWIARVLEECLVAGGLVVEDELICPTSKMLRQLFLVLRGLVCNAAKRDACLLRLDDSGGFATYEEQVITWAIGEGELSDGHSFGCVAIECVFVLQDPARRHEQFIDLFSGKLFGRCRCQGALLSQFALKKLSQSPNAFAVWSMQSI